MTHQQQKAELSDEARLLAEQSMPGIPLSLQDCVGQSANLAGKVVIVTWVSHGYSART